MRKTGEGTLVEKSIVCPPNKRGQKTRGDKEKRKRSDRGGMGKQNTDQGMIGEIGVW